MALAGTVISAGADSQPRFLNDSAAPAPIHESTLSPSSARPIVWTQLSALHPSKIGFPDATTVGPAAGTVFRDFAGELEIHQDGAVIDGWRVKGAITVDANNVTIRNCEVNATGEIWGISLADGHSGLKVTNCRVYAVPVADDYDGTHTLTGIGGDQIEVGFSDISGVENAISTGNGYIHDNYIHDFAAWDGRDNHTDGLQTYGWEGAGGLRVIHNTIIGIITGGTYTPTRYLAGSSAIALSEAMHDLTIDGNLFAGGTYALYGPSQKGSSPKSVHVTNNSFSNYYFPNCGQFGFSDGFNPKAPDFVWSGNVVHETGAIIGP
ncbi:hypothetical protein SAZ10_07330 [Mesorhizobium sp. BAC0120]|uniref:hypothetical protein n=1 Tax=Mesorhizobium sp. BAC0120 TaxID=3090670 RepID=UPI00298BD2D9|nr:hypothetical protein [Mesorhizobium sp. BAC0120]MDW6021576.1 hypothetical protein [Mesorhizobium sp. BAC0120]